MLGMLNHHTLTILTDKPTTKGVFNGLFRHQEFQHMQYCQVTILDRDYSRTATPNDVRCLRSSKLG